MQVSTTQVPQLIESCIDAGLVPMLHGSPGTAKSSMIKQVAESRNLKVIDLRLSQCDPTDLMGFPTVCKITKKAGYLPMDTFPTAKDDLPEGYDGWMLFLDEMNSATPAVQAAAYKVVLDRQVGQFDLHEKVYIAGAGNLDTDRAITQRMSTAMQSRLVHFEVNLDSNSWLEWAADNKIDERVISYINFKPTQLHNFRPDHDDKTFPCARTWEFVSKLSKNIPEYKPEHLALLAGTVGTGAAREYTTFCKVYSKLITFDQILNDPKKAKVPSSEHPDVLFATAGMIAYRIDETNINTVLDYINRMPAEFQGVTMRTACRVTPAIRQTKDWKVWCGINAEKFL